VLHHLIPLFVLSLKIPGTGSVFKETVKINPAEPILSTNHPPLDLSSSEIGPKCSRVHSQNARIDANREAGPVINRYYGTKIDCGYPLVSEVLKLCFGLDKTPVGKSVEDLFSEASHAGNYKPMEALVERLMGADYSS
jgi:hypothetical protein